jgi:hypothetical protein
VNLMRMHNCIVYQVVRCKADDYGDINRFKIRAVADLQLALPEFGEDGAIAADVDRDKTVDQSDLKLILDTYNTLNYDFLDKINRLLIQTHSRLRN